MLTTFRSSAAAIGKLLISLGLRLMLTTFRSSAAAIGKLLISIYNNVSQLRCYSWKDFRLSIFDSRFFRLSHHAYNTFKFRYFPKKTFDSRFSTLDYNKLTPSISAVTVPFGEYRFLRWPERELAAGASFSASARVRVISSSTAVLPASVASGAK